MIEKGPAKRARRLAVPSPGVALLGAVVTGSVVVWVAARPGGQPDGRYLGEFLGAEAVLLFSCTLVLATLLRGIERAFGGLDRVAQWHRRTAVAGVVLLVAHPSFAGSTSVPDVSAVGVRLGDAAALGLLALALWSLAPSLRGVKWSRLVRYLARLSHERWLTGHRLTGLLVAAAVVHGLLVDPVLRVSVPLRACYLAVSGLGLAAYLYRELFARFVVPVYDYTVAEVRRPSESTVDVFLRPTGRVLRFEPGQFIFLAFGGVDGWQRHPFSVASAPAQRLLEVSVKAVGDYTRDLNDKLKPGTPATVAGPFGGFDYRGGGRHQIWIAGGIGITPFMSWIRALDDGFDRDVAFFYAVARACEALYLDEIGAAEAAHPTLRPRVVDSGREGYLTAGQTVGGTGDVADVADVADVWVYMCGPPAMMTALSRGFLKLGIPASQIRWEQFNVR